MQLANPEGPLEDPRDLPFVWLMTKAALWLIPAVTVLYIPGLFRWWMMPVYLAVTMGWFFPPFTLMLHCTAHRPLFKKRVGWMNHLIPVVLAPFFGQTPFTYGAHHLGMHHPENNLWKDKSSTLPFRRDSRIDFLRYVGRFFIIGLGELVSYLWLGRKRKLVRRVVAGELTYWGACAALIWLNAGATLTVFVVPLCVARFAMMAGNWGQHAFVDRATPDSAYRNSITCIEVGYNERCFNDGYHIGHHLQPRMHWTELPVEFEKNRERYVQEEALVLRGIDFFGVWALLMLKAHRRIAGHIVQHAGMPENPEKCLAIMNERLAPIPPPAQA